MPIQSAASALDFGPIRTRGRARKISRAEVERTEANLWLTFPRGYREFMAKFGEGVYRRWIVVYSPRRIEAGLIEWRRRIARTWTWDKGQRVLPRDRATECVPIAETLNGDELVFHPSRPDKLFVLPLDLDQVFAAGEDLARAIAWMSSGKLGRAGEQVFEPKKIANARARRSGHVGESLDAIVDSGRAWAHGRGARREAARELRASVPKGSKAIFAFEAIVLDGEFPLEPGYLAEWTVTGARGKRLGVYRSSLMEDGSLASYEPLDESPFASLKLPRASRRR